MCQCAPVGQMNLRLLQEQVFRADNLKALGMEATPGWVDQLWTKGICSSHPQPLLGKVKTAGRGCDFHGSFAAILGTPSCVLVMPHIILTKGLLQAHSESGEAYGWRVCYHRGLSCLVPCRKQDFALFKRNRRYYRVDIKGKTIWCKYYKPNINVGVLQGEYNSLTKL